MGQSQRAGKGHGRFYKQESSNQQSGQENRNNNTYATGVNRVALKNKEKDLSKIIYYNCNNKGYYANVCPDLPKGKN